VALLLRSAEIQPLFEDLSDWSFHSNHPPPLHTPGGILLQGGFRMIWDASAQGKNFFFFFFFYRACFGEIPPTRAARARGGSRTLGPAGGVAGPAPSSQSVGCCRALPARPDWRRATGGSRPAGSAGEDSHGGIPRCRTGPPAGVVRLTRARTGCAPPRRAPRCGRQSPPTIAERL